LQNNKQSNSGEINMNTNKNTNEYIDEYHKIFNAEKYNSFV